MAKCLGYSLTLKLQLTSSLSSFSSKIMILSSPRKPKQTCPLKQCTSEGQLVGLAETWQAMIWWRASSLQLSTRTVLSSSQERQRSLLPGLPLVTVLGPAPSIFIDFSLFHATFSGLNSQQQRISVPRSAMNRAELFSEKVELWQWALACLSGLGPCPSWTMKEWTWVGRWLTSLQMMADPLVQLVATMKLAVWSRERWQGSSPMVGTTAKTLKFQSVTTMEPLACSLTMQQQPSCLMMQEGLDCYRTGLAVYSPVLRRQTLGEQPPMTTSTPLTSITCKQYNIYEWRQDLI